MSTEPKSAASGIARYSRYRPSSTKSSVSAIQPRIGVDFIQHFRPAQRLHLIQYPFAPLLNEPGRRRHRIPLLARADCGDGGGIAAREPGRGLVEESLRGGFGAIRT